NPQFLLGGQSVLELTPADRRGFSGGTTIFRVSLADANVIGRAAWQDRPAAGQVRERCLQARLAVGEALLMVPLCRIRYNGHGCSSFGGRRAYHLGGRTSLLSPGNSQSAVSA